MKTLRRLLLLVLCTMLMTEPIFAHKEWVHQYILQQAYDFLLNQLRQDPKYGANKSWQLKKSEEQHTLF